MGNHRFVAAGAVLLALLFGFPEQGNARQWRATPTSQAQEYVFIDDDRSESELVMIMWISPEILERSSENEAARSMLQEYVLVGVVHVNISDMVEFTFTTPTGVLLQTANGEQRQPLAENSLPPLVAGTLSVLKASFAQGIGAMGQGFRWHVFHGAGIDSCQKGIFWIAYAGERYDYETPIPGCP